MKKKSEIGKNKNLTENFVSVIIEIIASDILFFILGRYVSTAIASQVVFSFCIFFSVSFSYICSLLLS